VEPETVFLDLDSFSLKSYNAMQAVFVINAVDSQRVDKVGSGLERVNNLLNPVLGLFFSQEREREAVKS
jgi:hypothetical protein